MSTLVIHHESLYLRFFLWVWGIGTEQLNACKLFWGTVFFPFGIFATNKRRVIAYSILALFYTLLAVVSLMNGSWILATFWLFFGVLDVFFSCMFHQGLPEDERSAVLSKITERGSEAFAGIVGAIAETIFDIEERFNLVDHTRDLVDAPVIRRINGFFSLAREYERSFKKRFCPEVRVI